MIRDREQAVALKSWIDSNYRATIVACTGFGKTRVGVKAINHISGRGISKVIICVPTQNLRDIEWRKELDSQLDPWLKDLDIEIQCTQSLYKDADTLSCDLLIIDEVHLALSTEYGNVFNIKHDYLLCLTATAPDNEEYLDKLQELAPISYTITALEAKNLGIISDFIILCIPVKFNQKERWMYNKFNNDFVSAKASIDSWRRTNLATENAFELAQLHKDIPTSPIHQASKKFWSSMGMRKKILQSAESKVSTAKEIIQKYEIKKWIAFSKYINQAESLYEELQLSEIPSVLYTSKMDDKTRKENLVKVEDPSIRAICSAEALNTGYNLPELDGAIAMSFSSDAISLTQQLGRCVRFKQNKQAIYINLFIPSTQEEVWMKSRLKGMQYLVLSGTKELKNYIN